MEEWNWNSTEVELCIFIILEFKLQFSDIRRLPVRFVPPVAAAYVAKDTKYLGVHIRQAADKH